MDIVQSTIDKCQQLQRLHDRLVEELRTLKEGLNQEEHEGVENPIVTVNIMKSLQEALNTVIQELEKCPPET